MEFSFDFNFRFMSYLLNGLQNYHSPFKRVSVFLNRVLAIPLLLFLLKVNAFVPIISFILAKLLFSKFAILIKHLMINLKNQIQQTIRNLLKVQILLQDQIKLQNYFYSRYFIDLQINLVLHLLTTLFLPYLNLHQKRFHQHFYPFFLQRLFEFRSVYYLNLFLFQNSAHLHQK